MQKRDYTHCFPISGRGPLRPLPAGGFLAFLVLLALLDRMPMAIAGFYTGIGILTFLVYARDKAAARCAAWRAERAAQPL